MCMPISELRWADESNYRARSLRVPCQPTRTCRRSARVGVRSAVVTSLQHARHGSLLLSTHIARRAQELLKIFSRARIEKKGVLVTRVSSDMTSRAYAKQFERSGTRSRRDLDAVGHKIAKAVREVDADRRDSVHDNQPQCLGRERGRAEESYRKRREVHVGWLAVGHLNGHDAHGPYVHLPCQLRRREGRRTLASYGSPVMTSGASQYGVPIVVLRLFLAYGREGARGQRGAPPSAAPYSQSRRV